MTTPHGATRQPVETPEPEGTLLVVLAQAYAAACVLALAGFAVL